MQLSLLDWIVLALYGLTVISLGLIFARKAGVNTEEYFLAGRSMPWWLLGTSMVATTFSSDTPNLVSNLVRNGGVSQNWIWWNFVITGMCTVFFYAKLWRRSGVITDIGFYELRYSGQKAAFLRGFRAIYLGVFVNVMIMASVTLSVIKIGEVLLGVDKYTTVLVAGTVTLIYSATSGLRGILMTDLLLFGISMVGSILAAFYALQIPEVGGLSGLMINPVVADKISFLPDFSNPSEVIAILIIPLAVQWWSTWYPGAEPGGGGYSAQRMLAAKDEKNALQATLWFNIAHYALRPWPWILVALASLVVYPTIEDLALAFPNVDKTVLGHDMAYPAMLTFIPHGLLGLVVASLIAAYMSTISTHLNWGSSYLIDDVYRRFYRTNREEKHYVRMGRFSTLGLMLISSIVALQLQTAMQAFQILLQIGAGTGLVFLLRWFWWRINGWTEIAAMAISFLTALYFGFVHTQLGFQPWSPSTTLVVSVIITTTGWLVVTLLTAPEDTETLRNFYHKIRPLGSGWHTLLTESEKEAYDNTEKSELTASLLSWFLGCVLVYSCIFGTGFIIYGHSAIGVTCILIAGFSGWGILKLLPRIGLLR
tara:strand:- start:145 stop:1929 length:1785 start_codon:yes stop_codon:yes gene_type:complete